MAQPRHSLSPSRFSETVFEAFQQTNEEVLTEGTVISTIFPIIAGSARIPYSENLYFGNLKDLTDGSITKARPDFYDRGRPAELDKHIREELGPYIVPSTNTAAPYLPNFFTKAKRPKGASDVYKRQALYDGVLSARGIHELWLYVDPETSYDDNTYTITSTHHPSGLLTIYTTHPTVSESPTNPTEYRMTQLRSFAMTDAPDTFRQGAGALRKARDWAKEKREELIIAANGKALDPGQSSLVSSNEPTRPESETSADELALDIDTFASSSRKTLVGARTDPPPKD